MIAANTTDPATEPQKPKAPEGVDQGKLDQVVEATERRFKDDAILYVFDNIDAYMKMARSIARSGVTHHKTEAHVITIAMAAYEMGLGVMEALRGMYVVDGKLAMETWLLDRLAISRGVTKTIHETGLFRCRLTLHHDDRPDVESEFTLEDAKRAGIIKDYDSETYAVDPVITRKGRKRGVWDKHPEELLYWRALSKGLRRIAPDLFGGVYTADEADGIDPRKAHEPATTDTNAELDALTEPVEPDPNEYTEDEIDKYRQEMDEAVRRSLITSDDAAYAQELVVDARWAEAREHQSAVRTLLARAKADEAEGKKIREDVEAETADLFEGEG